MKVEIFLDFLKDIKLFIDNFEKFSFQMSYQRGVFLCPPIPIFLQDIGDFLDKVLDTKIVSAYVHTLYFKEKSSFRDLRGVEDEELIDLIGRHKFLNR